MWGPPSQRRSGGWRKATPRALRWTAFEAMGLRAQGRPAATHPNRSAPVSKHGAWACPVRRPVWCNQDADMHWFAGGVLVRRA
jgi:hypothetical protein